MDEDSVSPMLPSNSHRSTFNSFNLSLDDDSDTETTQDVLKQLQEVRLNDGALCQESTLNQLTSIVSCKTTDYDYSAT